MGYTTHARDWKIAGIAQVGGAAIVGGGVWFFVLQSERADFSGTFSFAGFGLGAGGSAGGGSAPDLSTRGLSWTELECDRLFCAEDMDGCGGRLSTAGAGLAVGAGITIVSAFNWGGSMFESQNCIGFTIGVGAGAMTTSGFWKMLDSGRMRR